MPKTKKTKPERPTAITVFSGIQIVARPGANKIVLGSLASAVEDMKDDWVDEMIVDLLEGGDPYECAKVLRAHPARLDAIAQIIAKAGPQKAVRS